MPEIHPHWQATEDEAEVPVRASAPRASSAAEKRAPIPLSQVSRRPAALIGIFFVLAIGLTFFQGIDPLPAQLPTSVTIRITATGFEPRSVTARPGQDIVWRNEGETPQILQSDQLCGRDGSCLTTNTMFQGDTTSFSITSEILPGTYSYYSTTSPGLTGEVVVAADGGAGGTPGGQAGIPSALQTATAPTAGPRQGIVTDGVFTLDGGPQGPQPQPGRGTAAVARNPYTVESGRTHPYGPSGEPIEEYQASQQLHAGAPLYGTADIARPAVQPETGPRVWLALGLSLGAFWLLARWMIRGY